MTRFQSISSEKLSEIISKNGKMIEKIAAYYAKRFKLPYEEVYQATLIAIWQNYKFFNEKDKMSLSSFINKSTFWVLSKEYKNYFGKKVEYNEEIEVEDKTTSGVNINLADFYDCLNSIPKKYREVLHSYYIENKTLSQIAKEIGVCTVSAMKYKNKGLNLFSKKWGEKCQNKK